MKTKTSNPLRQLREWAEKHPALANRIPSIDFMGGRMLPKTELRAIKKVLSEEGMDIFIRGGYKSIKELAIERPGLWLPTKELRICRNRCVTDAFVADVVDALQGSATPYGTFDDYKYHHSGEGTGDEAVGDTALGTPREDARDVGTQIEGATANVYKSVATTTYTGTYAITEHGLFNGAGSGGPPVTGATLMDRTKFSAINVVATNQIEWTFTITFTAGG